MVLYPRPPSLRKSDPQEGLLCDLLNLGQPCGLLSVIVPLAAKVKHDHRYSLNARKSQPCGASVPSYSSTSIDLTLNSNTNNDELQAHNQDDINLVFESSHRTEKNIEKLSLSAQQRIKLGEQTKSQSSSDLWFEARRQRLTESMWSGTEPES
jgi:hypothetical protein